jgi:hypothetical protein
LPPVVVELFRKLLTWQPDRTFTIGGIADMEKPEMSKREEKVFRTGLFDDLTVQDIYTIIAIFSAYYNPEGRQETRDRIMEILSRDDLFDEKTSHTIDRINKFTNSMKEVDPLNAIEKAAISLTPELRKEAFRLAVRICKAAQDIRTTEILETLAVKLSIDKDTINQAMGKSPHKG